MTDRLPLFLKDELNRLQERRDALLRRIQNQKKHSPTRYELIGRVKEKTADIMRIENELRGGFDGR